MSASWSEQGWNRPAQGMGVVGVGAAGEPSPWRMRPDLCAQEGHPGVTYNPWMKRTWCLCGSVIREGDTVEMPLADRRPPLREAI